MYYTIYQIVNKIDGKIYIGKHQTKNLDDGYMGSGIQLTKAQKKHGLESFFKEILFVFNSEEEMNSKEAELVSEEFCLRKDTYNICPGGKGGWGYVNINKTAESLQNMHRLGGSASLKKRRNNPDKYAKSMQKATQTMRQRKTGIFSVNNKRFSGKTHSEETKNKMRKSKNIGKHNSQYGTCWITNGFINKKHKIVDYIPEGWY